MDPRARRRCPAQGFSLVEVLVAFVIMSLTLGVLFQVFGTGLRSSAVAEETLRASVLASSRLALAADVTPLRAGHAQGRFDGTDLRWEQRIERLDPGAYGLENVEGFATFSVSVTVAWPAGQTERAVTLRTLRLQREGP